MSKVLGVSRNTVAEVQALFLQSGRSWDDISEWDDDRLYELFYPDNFDDKNSNGLIRIWEICGKVNVYDSGA